MVSPLRAGQGRPTVSGASSSLVMGTDGEHGDGQGKGAEDGESALGDGWHGSS